MYIQDESCFFLRYSAVQVCPSQETDTFRSLSVLFSVLCLQFRDNIELRSIDLTILEKNCLFFGSPQCGVYTTKNRIYKKYLIH